MKYVDLGLPSKTLWADENLVFKNTSPINYCDFETVIREYKDYTPTNNDYDELVEYCKCKFLPYKGLVIKGPNKNTIFLPALGLYTTTATPPQVFAEGFAGYYWFIGKDNTPRTLSFNGEDNRRLPEHLDESRYDLYENYFCLRTIKRPL